MPPSKAWDQPFRRHGMVALLYIACACLQVLTPDCRDQLTEVHTFRAAPNALLCALKSRLALSTWYRAAQHRPCVCISWLGQSWRKCGMHSRPQRSAPSRHCPSRSTTLSTRPTSANRRRCDSRTSSGSPPFSARQTEPESGWHAWVPRRGKVGCGLGAYLCETG